MTRRTQIGNGRAGFFIRASAASFLIPPSKRCSSQVPSAAFSPSRLRGESFRGVRQVSGHSHTKPPKLEDKRCGLVAVSCGLGVQNGRPGGISFLSLGVRCVSAVNAFR